MKFKGGKTEERRKDEGGGASGVWAQSDRGVDYPGNYRPIANVSFISKILERIIASQLVAYFDAYDLLPGQQSGFRRNHSTETLLVRLLSDWPP